MRKSSEYLKLSETLNASVDVLLLQVIEKE